MTKNHIYFLIDEIDAIFFKNSLNLAAQLSTKNNSKSTTSMTFMNTPSFIGEPRHWGNVVTCVMSLG